MTISHQAQFTPEFNRVIDITDFSTTPSGD